MAKGQGKYKGLICAAIFIVLEIAALSMLSRTSSLQSHWLKRIAYRPLSVLWRGAESVRSYFSLKGQNERLAEENFALNEKLRAAAVAAQAPQSGLNTRMNYIPATIVKMSRNSQHNYIILDKGSDDGVLPLSGIISDKGVVGIVDVVDRNYSYGLTLMNDAVQVSSRIGRDGIVAPLVWDGIHSDRAVVNCVPLHYEAAPPDTVYTSGFSSVFPSDIPLGTVVGTSISHGAIGQVKVRLFQDFSTLRFVTIVSSGDRQVIEELSAHREGAKK